jgi:hypothetical protein
MRDPTYPSLYQINTRVRLTEPPYGGDACAGLHCLGRVARQARGGAVKLTAASVAGFSSSISKDCQAVQPIVLDPFHVS